MIKMKYIFTCLLLLSATLSTFSQSLGYMEWVDRSAEYIDKNQLDSAATALYNAMSLEPANENNPVLLLNLGILQRQLGHYDDAYISFTASLTSNPIPDIVLHNRASLLVELGRLDEAMEDYDAILKDFPHDIEAFYRRGVLHLENHDRAKAEADFKRSEEIDSDNMYTKLSRALIYKLDDNWEPAEKVYTDLIENEPYPDLIFYLNRAECYVNTNQMFKASADLRSLGDTQRNNPYFYFLRGRVRLEQFDKTAAKADFEKAKELGYDSSIVDDWLKKTK
jgi:tetratricopeptide (TPR) repeat protein